MNSFEIPIVLIVFKRIEKSLKVLERISEVKPRKLYILSDEGRNEEEKELVQQCRENIERNITWQCEIIKNYAHENKGVYQNIAEGAKWVFSREKWAIFLEDDNLPEITFFDYCKELLYKYEHDERIFWICGTNYLGKYKPASEVSYMFTKHLLPCGWASWSTKFLKYYDGELELAQDEKIIKGLEKDYLTKALYKQQMEKVKEEKLRKENGEKFSSWDHQMAFSIRAHNVYGISPINNQIKNIGVDEYSEHGGVSYDNVMTQRFCGMGAYPLEFPLKHPKKVHIDYNYEKEITHIIQYPFSMRMKKKVSSVVKKSVGLKTSDSLTLAVKKIFKGKS